MALRSGNAVPMLAQLALQSENATALADATLFALPRENAPIVCPLGPPSWIYPFCLAKKIPQREYVAMLSQTAPIVYPENTLAMPSENAFPVGVELVAVPKVLVTPW